MDKILPLLSQSELRDSANKFKFELIAALSNQQSSLPTILNPVHKLKSNPGFGVAVSVGGTNGYVSAFRIYKNGVIKFLNRKLFFLPVKTTKEDLFNLITKHILTAAGSRKKTFPIGIGFAYSLKPLMVDRFIDGELVVMSKERTIEGLVGRKIGQEYHKFLIKNFGIDTNITVTNDSICLLLGGDGVEIAGIVGTGLNFAYWENRTSIAPRKLIELHRFVQSEVAINIESANFNKIPVSALGKIVDKKSDDRGENMAEKESAGAYLYQLFNAGRVKMKINGFFDLTSTDQLNDIITGAYKFPADIKTEDKDRAFLLAERIFHRSAQIVAIELCGIMLKLNKTRGIVPIVMEGGIFWYARNYPALVNLYVNMILPEVIPSFARLFGSARRGIAILARGF